MSKVTRFPGHGCNRENVILLLQYYEIPIEDHICLKKFLFYTEKMVKFEYILKFNYPGVKGNFMIKAVCEKPTTWY